MPVANTENCYRDSSHLLYILAFTAMKDSPIINFDYNSNSIPKDLDPQLYFTTLLPRGTAKEQKITNLVIFTRPQTLPITLLLYLSIEDS